MKCYAYRWLGVVVSALVHVVIVSFWWHQTNAIGSSSTLTYPARDGSIDVRLIQEPIPVIGSVSGAAPIERQRQHEEVSVANLKSYLARDVTTKSPPVSPPAPIFYGPQEIDKEALPYSAPDPELLAGLIVSGVPIRLRLYIDANGLVTGVEQLQALPDDQDAVERIDKMLRGTTFMPARLGGIDVNSYQDLEFNIGPELN